MNSFSPPPLCGVPCEPSFRVSVTPMLPLELGDSKPPSDAEGKGIVGVDAAIARVWTDIGVEISKTSAGTVGAQSER